MRPNIDENTAFNLRIRADAISSLNAQELGVGKQIEIIIDELDDVKNEQKSERKKRLGEEWYTS